MQLVCHTELANKQKPGCGSLLPRCRTIYRPGPARSLCPHPSPPAPAAARGFATQTEIGIVSGLPPLAAGRKVVIYSPARTAGQQGLSQTAEGACCSCCWGQRVPGLLRPEAVVWVL